MMKFQFENIHIRILEFQRSIKEWKHLFLGREGGGVVLVVNPNPTHVMFI